MTGDPHEAGRQDLLCINPKLDYEVKDWALEFDVSPEQLRAALTVVGPAAKDVQNFLQGGRAAPSRGLDATAA